MEPLKNVLLDFGDLFFPRTCPSCRIPLVKGEENICEHCWAALPQTQFHRMETNPLQDRLLGRFPFLFGAALFRFEAGNKVQEIMNQIKYKNRPDLAFYFGQLYGRDLREKISKSHLNFVVPVPLHPKKLRQRGYNQSEYFARGLGLGAGIPVFPCIKRALFTETQTKKDKIDRWLNVSNAFEIADLYSVKGNSFLLVDDVFTTGATIEACAQTLLKAGAANLSVATLAIAIH